MASDSVPATDRGLAYGDGMFRTLQVRAGRAVHWERHVEKLAADCGRLAIACPAADVLHEDVMAVTAEQPDAAVKIIITRGIGARGYRPTIDARANRVVIATPLPVYPERYAMEGVMAHLCRIRLGTQPALAGMKHLNRLENVIARAEWEEGPYAEGILCDEQGDVISGTMTNLFILEGERLSTPDLSRCGVAGVTRALVLERAVTAGIASSIERIALDRVVRADEVFLVNSLIGLWPVRSIAGKAVRTGPMASRIRNWIDESGSPR
jgi:4-amino-4-deoxychorismate lyase